MTSASTAKRIQAEFRDVMKNDMLTAEMVANDLLHWRGKFLGPDDTPFAKGVFVVDIVIPKEYPFVPPKMRFETKVWHPNVSSATGAICLDILKNEWSPALSISTALISLQALMCSPNPDDPQDATVADQYKQNQAAWVAEASKWTKQYAVEPFKLRAAESPRSVLERATTVVLTDDKLSRFASRSIEPEHKQSPVENTGVLKRKASERFEEERPLKRARTLDPKVQNLVNMGFDAEMCMNALAAANGVEESALEFLLSS